MPRKRYDAKTEAAFISAARKIAKQPRRDTVNVA